MFEACLVDLDTMTADEQRLACMLGLELCADRIEQLSIAIEVERRNWLSDLADRMSVDAQQLLTLPRIGAAVEGVGVRLDSEALRLTQGGLVDLLYRGCVQLSSYSSGRDTREQVESSVADLLGRLEGLVQQRAAIYELANKLVYRLYGVRQEEAEAIREELVRK